ncbi:glycosyltransferase family 2 protein [Candidatus Pelagibacter sp.]|nr:glycosyltransferase family 2 protein [Candidatus Pelagibacter sp.]|tara:strand:- start:560 stop:1444 length:885 start_codon:yes stop_codon:yes gene_type:complete
MPLVSIIVPTFNSKAYLSKLCESILNQTFKNYEVIIIDNSSQDNTPIEIKKIIKNDNRFKFYKINNDGVIGKSRNYGIKKALGKYIAFHDSDDYWYAKKIEICLQYLTHNDFTYHHLKIQNQNNFYLNNKKLFSYQLSKNPFIDLLTIGNPISTSSVVCKKSIFNDDTFFSEEKRFISIEDYDCWVNLSKNNCKFKEIPIVLGKYFMGPSNTSTSIKNYNNYRIFHILNNNQHLLNYKNKKFAKNHFRYLLANDLKKIKIKYNIYYYLFFQKIIKISKIKILLKIIITYLKKII